MKPHLRDLAGLAVTPARLLWRHWPVLTSLAVAGLVVRRVLVNTAVYLAGVNAYVGFVVLLLAPLAVLAALVFMLRALRPLAPALTAHLGSALVAFLGFYMAFGLLGEDLRGYGDGLADGRAVNVIRDPGLLRTLALLGVVVVALGLRWLLARPQRPRLGGFASAVEAVGIALGLLLVLRPVTIMSWGWTQQRTAWLDLAGWWGRVRGNPALAAVDRWLVDAFPAGYVTAIFLVPLTGLLVACVAFGISAAPPARTRPDGIRRHRVGALAMRRYAPLFLGLRAVRRTGVVPLMAFCLAVATLQAAVVWLRLAEARLIGPHEPDGLAVAYQPSIDVANQVVALVVLVGLLGAGADLVARHLVEPEPVPAGPDSEARPAMPTAPPPQWPLPQPAWAGTPEGKLTPPAWPNDPPPSR